MYIRDIAGIYYYDSDIASCMVIRTLIDSESIMIGLSDPQTIPNDPVRLVTTLFSNPNSYYLSIL